MSDLPWIADQMHSAAVAIEKGRAVPQCYFCDGLGPGLYWLPSEEGIIEIPVWSCGPCVRDHEELLAGLDNRRADR